MAESKTVDIFRVDPDELRSFVGSYVDITLVNNGNISGLLYTIDPVTQSVVLLNKNEDGSYSAKIILKHSVYKLKQIDEVPLNLQDIYNDGDLDDVVLRMFAEDPVVATKESIKSWLSQNMIEFEECGDIIKMDSLEIHPPYGPDDCISSNQIVLKRVRHILQSMPVPEQSSCTLL